MVSSRKTPQTSDGATGRPYASMGLAHSRPAPSNAHLNPDAASQGESFPTAVQVTRSNMTSDWQKEWGVREADNKRVQLEPAE